MAESNSELTNGLFERLPSREEVEVRLTENARERKLLEQLLRLAKQREGVERSASDVARNREGLSND